MRNPQQTPPNPQKGYGNIYTPHAGSMIIQVQREGGLANRTIILSQRKVRALRFLMSRNGKILIAALGLSWIYFAVQAVRIPLLTHRISTMERDAQRLDTLQLALGELQKRYEQVQGMLSASGTLPRSMQGSPAQSAAAQSAVAAPAPVQKPAPEPVQKPAPARPPAPAAATVSQPAATDSLTPTLPSQWPLPPGTSRFITRGKGGESLYNGPHPGLDVAIPVGTEVRAAGAGLVVEVGENDEYGRYVRLAHADGYETLYAHTSQVLVQRGQRVPAGRLIALSGNTGRSTAPHLHFEVRRAGQAVDPLQLIKQGL